MRVLLVGGGGREHAMAKAITRSATLTKLYCAPGNAGIAELAQCVDIAARDVERLATFARDENIDLVVVGPEEPLVLGLTDRLQRLGIAAFGPTGRRRCSRQQGLQGDPAPLSHPTRRIVCSPTTRRHCATSSIWISIRWC
ncbi:MAG: phosphoribosylamine--glycine ligase N-terminal domain-containing protein [Planctomycetota bacterium]